MQIHPKLTLFSLLVGIGVVSFGWGAGAMRTAPAAAAFSSARPVRVAMVDRRAMGYRTHQMMLPSRSAITSRFGQRRLGSHHGVDLRASVGTPVKAALPGRVVFAGWKNSIYGNMVAVSHGNGLVTRYAHNSRLLVRPGQRVQEGQVLARSGNTGRTTGPHIHFEVMRNGRAVNPLLYARR